MSLNSSLHPAFNLCANIQVRISVCAFTVTKSVTILPLSMLVLYLGYQRWRQQRSFNTTSHSDIFTYHLAVMELIGVPGGTLVVLGFRLPAITLVGTCLASMSVCGEMMFHILTCVERYMAVVHPVTYLGLRKVGGVRIRNTCIGWVWLSSIGWSGVIALYYPSLPTVLLFGLIVFSLIVISFCSIVVLCVLIRPGPGEAGSARERVDQSKRRAFNTVLVIMAVLWLYFIGFVVGLAVDASALVSRSDSCLVMLYGTWLNLPSSLVLPLLFLHRAGKLSCC